MPPEGTMENDYELQALDPKGFHVHTINKNCRRGMVQIYCVILLPHSCSSVQENNGQLLCRSRFYQEHLKWSRPQPTLIEKVGILTLLA